MQDSTHKQKTQNEQFNQIDLIIYNTALTYIVHLFLAAVVNGVCLGHGNLTGVTPKGVDY